MKEIEVRVRYAPSPTGFQHIGGVRTALFNYLFARANNGTFILRIEDTDRSRYSEEALNDIYETFDWLGFRWDEGPDVGGPYGPYFQSKRLEIYQEYAKKLIETGNAYYCYCTPERLERIRKIQLANKMAPGYDRHCRNLTPEERAEYEKQGIKPVIRFKIPLEGKTTFHDELLGDIVTPNEDINPDPVLLKSDGYPTYHLANVIDDHLMNITHIMRAQEWIPSGPLHVLLYKAFGWEPPKYCHLPMVMGRDGQKLSKRHGATSVREFRKQGYLPEALINYVALLGWSYNDTQEIFSLKELEKVFSMERLNKAPAVFDYKKLEWFNGVYIRKRPKEDIKELIMPYLIEEGVVSDPPTERELAIVEGAVPLIQERMRLLSDAPKLLRFLFKVVEYNPEEIIPKKLNREQVLEVLKEVRKIVAEFDKRTDEENEAIFRDLAARFGFKLGDVLMPLRVAITGTRVSPPLFGSIKLLGVEKSLERIDRVIELLSKENV